MAVSRRGWPVSPGLATVALHQDPAKGQQGPVSQTSQAEDLTSSKQHGRASVRTRTALGFGLG